MNTQQFGKFIAEQRKVKGYTQKELADKLGVTDKAVSRWENGHGYPDILLIEPLAKELEITIVELMHSKLNENNDFAPQKADEAISNAIDITISNRKLERKITIFIFIFSMMFFAGMSFLNGIPAYGMIAIMILTIMATPTITVQIINIFQGSSNIKVFL